MSQEYEDLLPQFAAEARVLLSEASAELLALEQSPEDEARINRLFRALHTLKGSSGLFTLPPLTRLLHAAEDVFQAMRERRVLLTPAAADQLFGALDEAALWVEELDAHGALPLQAGAVAQARAAALRALLPGQQGEGGQLAPGAAAASGAATAPTTTAAALERFSPAMRMAARALASQEQVTMVVHTPSPGCFYKGEDPLHLLLMLPGLCALALVPRGPWPSLDTLDPFDCALSFHALSVAPAASLAAHLRYVSADILVHPVSAAELDAAGALSEAAREVLAQQIALLAEPAPAEEQPHRLAAARRVARNALEGRIVFPEDETAEQLIARLRAVLAPAARGPSAGQGARPTAEARPGVPEPARSEPGAVPGGPPGGTPPGGSPAVKRTLRVDQDKIDALMQLAGELIVAKNSLPFLARRAEHQFGQRELAREIKDQSAVIDRITQALQEAVMTVRMMPVGQVFQRFPRLVRDLARQLDKRVDLVISGEETEADKNVIESLFDPLLHMVRNSLDHGIEPAALRRDLGKPETGVIALRARQEGDRVLIEIEDDGRGIDPAQVRGKALERGLRSAAALAAMDDEAVLELIFAPGFSTAERISDLSGRGVGMDVVRSAVQAAGGEVKLSSRLGRGTVMRLTLPLSMAVTNVMTVSLGTRLFGVPMQAVLETVRLPRTRLNTIRAATAFILREQVVPMRSLASLLQLEEGGIEDEEGLTAILVVEAGNQPVGIGVSDFGEVLEVILKPMPGVMRRVPGYSGTALMGDGRVLPVLSLSELLA